MAANKGRPYVYGGVARYLRYPQLPIVSNGPKYHHQVRHILCIYDVSETTASPYGAPRVGVFRLLRRESGIFGLISATVLHFWRRRNTRPHEPNCHAATIAPIKKKMRHRRDVAGPLRIPTDR